MTSQHRIDAAGRRRSPATMPGYHAGRPRSNKGRTYPADPPTVDEIIAVMRQASDSPHGLRARALIVVLWRAALRIQEALSLTESDLDPRRSSVLVREGRGGHRREVGIDSWALNTGLRPWLEAQDPTRRTAVLRHRRTHLRRPRVVKRRSPRRVPAPRRRRRRPEALCPPLRHAHAVELAREDVPLPILQRQLGHRNMATTPLYLFGIGAEEVIATVASRPAPMMSASAGLEL